MANDPSPIRHLFGEAPASDIDVSAVIRRSRARRAPRVLAAGSLAVLALGTVAYTGFSGFAVLGQSTATDMASESSNGGDTAGSFPLTESFDNESFSDDNRYSSESAALGACGGPVAALAQNESGLMLSLAFPSTAKAGAASIEGVVTMTNSGTSSVAGSTSDSPVVALVADGTIVSLVAPTTEAPQREFTLEPGESLDFAAAFSPVSCGQHGEVFPATGPPAPTGVYEIIAALSVSEAGDDSGTSQSSVTGPPQRVTLE